MYLILKAILEYTGVTYTFKCMYETTNIFKLYNTSVAIIKDEVNNTLSEIKDNYINV